MRANFQLIIIYRNSCMFISLKKKISKVSSSIWYAPRTVIVLTKNKKHLNKFEKEWRKCSRECVVIRIYGCVATFKPAALLSLSQQLYLKLFLFSRTLFVRELNGRGGIRIGRKPMYMFIY